MAPIDPPTNSVHPKSRAAWRTWLSKNHNNGNGVWLITYKKSAGKPRIEYNDAVEEALCFGWIDSKPKALDADRSMLWFAPRKPRSAWSKLNKDRVKKLIAGKRMSPAGLSKIEAAKKNGSWSALDEIEKITIPSDLEAAFKKYRSSEANFLAFPRFTKRAILEWIANAKKPETRAKRVEETARLAGQNVRANQWRQ